MSKIRPESEYQKTFAYKLFNWLEAEKDPYLDNVEMKEQHQEIETEETKKTRKKEKDLLYSKIYDINNNKEINVFSKFYVIASIIFCIAITAGLLLTVSYLPKSNTPDTPMSNEVVERYIEKGVEETGSINLVTGMILKYRAFDTFGETHVLFIATVCVMILLMLEDKEQRIEAEADDRKYEPKNDKILQRIAFVLVPTIFMFGIYVILNGHLSPGGGFSGGAILGSAMILYVSAFGFDKATKFFNEKIYLIIKITALVIYAIIMSYYFYMGAHGFDSHIPMGIPGNIFSSGMILIINILVGLEVACTMYAFYALFRRGNV